MFNFTKDMAKILSRLRKNANLTQKELANRMGIKTKYGQSLIAQIEMGKVSNPSLRTILDYLRSCGASWVEFFKELDIIDFKIRHEKMILQLPQPPESRKVHRAAIRYETGIEFPSKEKEEIDFDRLKKIIKDKVIALVNKEKVTLTSFLYHPGRGKEEGTFSDQGRGGSTNLSLRGAKRQSNLKENTNKEIATLPTVARNDELRKINQGRGGDAVITAYQKFAQEFFDFLAALNKPGRKMVVEKYQRAGLARHLLSKITKIVYSVIRAEIKRIEAKKPLPTRKQEKMAIGFTRYRIRMQQIESEVHKVLCELGVQPPWFVLYKDFARQCYRAYKRYWGKPILNQKLIEITNRWVKEGLKEDVLLKVKDVVIKVMEGR